MLTVCYGERAGKEDEDEVGEGEVKAVSSTWRLKARETPRLGVGR